MNDILDEMCACTLEVPVSEYIDKIEKLIETNPKRAEIIINSLIDEDESKHLKIVHYKTRKQ